MKIVIEKLKGIQHLEFSIPEKGLWLLTGLNGIGKTSLLISLFRIKENRAFQNYFRTSSVSSKLDTYINAKVTYEIGDKNVSYTYSGTRWPPKPKSNYKLLQTAPYSDVLYIEANGKRIEPYPNEIVTKKVKDVNPSISTHISLILHDDKWKSLKYVNTKRGTGNIAYLVPYKVNNATNYFSEKNFSLGEYCVVKLIEKLHNCPNGSLVLIDEIEIALHPQAQVLLLHIISEITAAKELTVIFSTHSSTLVKNIDRRQILFLKKESNNIQLYTNTYPAHVLGEIAFDEELNCDFIFFVEDIQAKFLLEQMFGLLEENNPGKKYFYRIIPVGGFLQVIEFLERSSQIFPRNVKRHAFLDNDVKTESIPKARRERTREILDPYERNIDKISFLPTTPEFGVTEFLKEKCLSSSNTIDINGQDVIFYSILSESEYSSIVCDKQRLLAKKRMDYIVSQVVNHYGIDEITIRRSLYRKYIEYIYPATKIGQLKSELLPIFNRT
jgi:ABC-type cobalamin/Fe3+-siderophores transport system ATPase subunit